MHVTDKQIILLLVLFLKKYYKTVPFVVEYKTKQLIGTAIFKSWLFVKVPVKL